MNFNIEETKKFAKTNISLDNPDVIIEGKAMYQNPKVLFPVKMPPKNNECFVSGINETKCRKKSKKKK